MKHSIKRLEKWQDNQKISSAKKQRDDDSFTISNNF